MRKNAIDDDLIKEAVFDAMLILNINYMPTVSQLVSIKTMQIKHYGISKKGTWLSNALKNRGGMSEWRKNLNLLTEKEYLNAIKSKNEE